MTELRYVLVTAMRREGMTWKEIAAEFSVRDGDSFCQTYRNEVDRRASKKYVDLLRRVAASA